MGSGSHFTFPLEITASLPAASAPSRCGHQPWTGSHSPCPETPLLGALGLTGCTEPRSSFIYSTSTRLQSVIHGNNIPALERGALSVPPVNSDVYLGNNSPPSSPLYWNSRTFFFFFCLLLAGKIPGFLCSRMVSLFSVCVEPGCLGAPRALRSAHVPRDTGGASVSFQTPQTDPNPGFAHPVEFGACCSAASFACRAKTCGIGLEMVSRVTHVPLPAHSQPRSRILCVNKKTSWCLCLE